MTNPNSEYPENLNQNLGRFLQSSRFLRLLPFSRASEIRSLVRSVERPFGGSTGLKEQRVHVSSLCATPLSANAGGQLGGGSQTPTVSFSQE